MFEIASPIKDPWLQHAVATHWPDSYVGLRTQALNQDPKFINKIFCFHLRQKNTNYKPLKTKGKRNYLCHGRMRDENGLEY
jgi:hypothetical protein